jgi:hypothetical protein
MSKNTTKNRKEPEEVLVYEEAEEVIEDKAPEEVFVRKQPDEGFCMYLGPSILGVIQYGTSYAGDKKEVLQQIEGAVAKYPLIASLIIPGAELASARTLVKTPGNLLYNAYRKLAKM